MKASYATHHIGRRGPVHNVFIGLCARAAIWSEEKLTVGRLNSAADLGEVCFGPAWYGNHRDRIAASPKTAWVLESWDEGRNYL
jgi:hypothetical protein